MKKYYIHNGTEQQGAFTKEDLKTKNITKETPIWHDGLSKWTTAEQIEELKDLFNVSTPPPFEAKATAPPLIQKDSNTQSNKSGNPKTKKANTTRSVLIVIGVGVLGFISLMLFNSMKSSGSGYTPLNTDSYQEKVMTVEEIERSQPTTFLTADGNYNENFWGDKIKVHGVIKNTATVASFKDAVVRVTYYSKTKTVLGTNDYTIYENFPPNSEKKFELKIENFKNVNSIGWDVIEATPN